MNKKINRIIMVIFESLVLLLALLTPFLFWSLTSEFYETPKFLLLTLATGILLVIWSIKLVVEGKTSLTRTPLDLPFLLLMLRDETSFPLFQ